MYVGMYACVYVIMYLGIHYTYVSVCMCMHEVLANYFELIECS